MLSSIQHTLSLSPLRQYCCRVSYDIASGSGFKVLIYINVFYSRPLTVAILLMDYSNILLNFIFLVPSSSLA